MEGAGVCKNTNCCQRTTAETEKKLEFQQDLPADDKFQWHQRILVEIVTPRILLDHVGNSHTLGISQFYLSLNLNLNVT
jgi:hypothetical protein